MHNKKRLKNQGFQACFRSFDNIRNRQISAIVQCSLIHMHDEVESYLIFRSPCRTCHGSACCPTPWTTGTFERVFFLYIYFSFDARNHIWQRDCPGSTTIWSQKIALSYKVERSERFRHSSFRSEGVEKADAGLLPNHVVLKSWH